MAQNKVANIYLYRITRSRATKGHPQFGYIFISRYMHTTYWHGKTADYFVPSHRDVSCEKNISDMYKVMVNI